MEMMPYRPIDGCHVQSSLAPLLPTSGPVAPSLHAQLTTDQVSRFISPPPASVASFERFITWTHGERAAGRYACFAVVPEGEQSAVGIFQVRLLDGRDGVAEWGFILGAAYWGTGLFRAGAHDVVTFAFTHMGLDRLEARASAGIPASTEPSDSEAHPSPRMGPRVMAQAEDAAGRSSAAQFPRRLPVACCVMH
ncbi:MAG: GNAT family N-acetyltransferase [Acidobacteria bacterium]|nr:GNAT family N-acetyltransferase [Acidobacteriota bacterium]